MVRHLDRSTSFDEYFEGENLEKDGLKDNQPQEIPSLTRKYC